MQIRQLPSSSLLERKSITNFKGFEFVFLLRSFGNGGKFTYNRLIVLPLRLPAVGSNLVVVIVVVVDSALSARIYG